MKNDKNLKSQHFYEGAATHRLRTRNRARRTLFALGSALILIWFALSGGLLTHQSDTVAGQAAPLAAVLPMLGVMGPLREEDDGTGDGGGIGAKILKKLDEQKKAVADMESQLADLPETKKSLEELKKSVDDFDGLSSDVKSFMEKHAELETKVANLRREASGDPKERLTQNEELRNLVTSPALKTYLEKKNKEVPSEVTEGAQRMASIAEGKALTGGASPGSHAIDDELITTVYQLIASYGRWAGFDILRPGARTAKIPVDTSDMEMVWATEGEAPTEGSYTGNQVTLNIRKAYGWISVANELLEDDEIGLASRIADKFGRATAKRLDHACFVADGTDDATHGDFEGVFNSGTAYDLPTGVDTIAELTLDHFTGLVAGADEALVESPTSRWWMHPQILVQLLNVKDANGRSIFLTALEAPAAGGLGSILGYPVVTSNMAPKTVAASTAFAAFGDQMGLAVGVRRDMEMASSADALFREDKTVYRTRMRAGTKIKDPTAFEVMTFGASS